MYSWTHDWPEVAQIVGVEHLYPHLENTDIVREWHAMALRFRDRLAVQDDRGEWSYGRLVQAVEMMAARLTELRVKEGDRVFLALPNSVEFVVSFFASLWVGAIAVPVNPGLGQEEMVRVIDDAKPRVFVYLASESVQPLEYPEMILWPLDVHDLFDGRGLVPQLAARNADRVAVVLYTSGTTGQPKGVMLSHRNILTSTTTYRYVFHLNETDRTLIAIPLFHVTGLVGQLLACLLVGAAVVLVRKYSARQYMEWVNSERISFIFAVPTILTLAFLREQNWQTPSHLRLVASGGASITPTLIARIQELLPHAAFYNTYGMTEVSSPAAILPPQCVSAHRGSVGLPVPGITFRVVDWNTGVDVGPDQPGELWMRGPMVTKGYWQRPDVTREVLAGGWLHSGDIASCDGEGFLTIHGRIKDMINRGGEKVYALDVERPLGEHPAVMESAVYGIDSAVWGEEVACAISFRPGMRASAEELNAWLRPRVARFKIPTAYRVWRELPRNANGKIDKRRLQQDHDCAPELAP
ncbi:MAG: hypothetical protein C7B45_06615 [Sulfobacillus acidophilus]|uniref:Long-chain fatty acid--CoA ligase n=1 Tax=Sulfobacillus acidophilus TaxID=53633 RepID=A0A2T2WJS0_9FIRM|nr:MAG: hypothetical protein C7B45_06615 [Sulfobacillus acidophilus]